MVPGIWTICRGATLVDGKPVRQGMKLTRKMRSGQCERTRCGVGLVDKNIHVPLTEPQKADCLICPYNIGRKCFPSTFYQRINAGDRKGAWMLSGGLRTAGKIAGTLQQLLWTD
jgi:lysozyme